ncbi:DUF6126 family protein [Streptomyces sp. NPDC059863]|uniref:DUF6126 family protein n=1 Tax=Streptomyces sp. NPDC059863 TaxID=3346976 RepID=UPI0036607BAF
MRGGSPRVYVFVYVLATHLSAVFAGFIQLLFSVGERAPEEARSAGEGHGSGPPTAPRPPPPARPSRRGVRRGWWVPWCRFGWRGSGAPTRSGRSCRWRCDSCAARSPGGSP